MVNLYFEQFEDDYDDPYWMDDYYEVDDEDYAECGCCCCTGDCLLDYDDYDDYEYQQDVYDGYMSDLYDDSRVG